MTHPPRVDFISYRVAENSPRIDVENWWKSDTRITQRNQGLRCVEDNCPASCEENGEGGATLLGFGETNEGH